MHKRPNSKAYCKRGKSEREEKERGKGKEREKIWMILMKHLTKKELQERYGK